MIWHWRIGTYSVLVPMFGKSFRFAKCRTTSLSVLSVLCNSFMSVAMIINHVAKNFFFHFGVCSASAHTSNGHRMMCIYITSGSRSHRTSDCVGVCVCVWVKDERNAYNLLWWNRSWWCCVWARCRSQHIIISKWNIQIGMFTPCLCVCVRCTRSL